VYDGEQTLKNVKRYILEQRREGNWTAERAKEEWELLEWNSLDSEYEFQRWHDDTKIQDAWDHDFAHFKTDIHMVAFMERAWPRLKACIQAELDAEAAHGQATAVG
jgi:hypothetical protein